MRRGLIRLQRLDHRFERDAQHATDCQSRHHVLGVVWADQLSLVHVEQRPAPVVEPADDQTAVEVNIRPPIARAERDGLRRDVHLERAQLCQRLALDDRPVERLLVHEQPRLGQSVVSEPFIAVQVIRRDVHQHPDCGPEILDGLKLERADFERQEIEILRLLRDGADWQADVPRRQSLDVTRAEQTLHELRRGGLAVRPGDGHVQAERVLIAELELADDGNLALVQLLKNRVRPRHARTDHREIEVRVRRFLRTELNGHAERLQVRRVTL